MFKEYVQFLNRLYDINWIGRLRLINSEAVYEKHKLSKPGYTCIQV